MPGSGARACNATPKSDIKPDSQRENFERSVIRLKNNDHQKIEGGDKWPEALRASADSCRVVVCLVTPNWLASLECFNEFGAAWYMGKRIIPLFLLPPSTKLNAEVKTRLDRVCGEDQGIDLTPCKKVRRALNIDADQNVESRLKTGLLAAGANSRVGLDPEAFAVDVKMRPMPFPGLSSFGDDDVDAARCPI